jgi:hypothetical protein
VSLPAAPAAEPSPPDPAPPAQSLEARVADAPLSLSDLDLGFLAGILVGEGHFGGDGRRAQITLRMHTDHAALFEWLVARVPGSRLYGPYDHAGRRYLQWMVRGTALRDRLVPALDRVMTPAHSGRAWERYQRMKDRYGLGSETHARTGSARGPR